MKNMKLNPGRVVFYPTYQEIDDRLFEDQSKVVDQWREFNQRSLTHCLMACQRHWVRLLKKLLL